MKFPAKYWIPGSILAILIIIELVLRLIFGFGNPVLIQADADTGYRFQPNQTVFRLGQNIQYNQYSQRSKPITAHKPPGTLRILMTGDSITNGGTLIDQTQTISALLEARIATQRQQPVEVLNASAGSWGIGNQLGYLRKFGIFESDAVLAQIGTADLTQPTSTGDRVGHDPSYPNRKPFFALEEVLTRYAWPKIAPRLGFNSPTVIPSPQQLNQWFQQNLQNLKSLIAVVDATQTPIFILYTPELKNLVPSYNIPNYKPEFIQFLKPLNIRVIDAHEAWSKLPKNTVKTFFIPDGIHLTATGNQAIANLLYERLCTERLLPTCSSI
jgi:lysophospholipase L1-like esterase